MVYRLTRTRKAQNKHPGWDDFIVFSEALSNNCQLLGREREREGEGWGREEERKIRDSHLHWNCYLPLKVEFSPRPHISIMRLSGNLALINGLGHCWLNGTKATVSVSGLLPKLCCTEMRMVRKERPSQGFWVKLGCHSPHFTLIIQMIMCREVRGEKGIKMTLMPRRKDPVNAWYFPENSHTIFQEGEWNKADEKMSPFGESLWNLVARQFIGFSSFVCLLSIHRGK